MLKVSIFLTRRADLTHDEFVTYWTQKHTPLLATYDGVAEVWVGGIGDAAGWFTSETCTTLVAADEEDFLDRSRTRLLYSVEDPVFS